MRKISVGFLKKRVGIKNFCLKGTISMLLAIVLACSIIGVSFAAEGPDETCVCDTLCIKDAPDKQCDMCTIEVALCQGEAALPLAQPSCGHEACGDLDNCIKQPKVALAEEPAECGHEACAGLEKCTQPAALQPTTIASFDALSKTEYEVPLGTTLSEVLALLQANLLARDAEGNNVTIEGVTWLCEAYNPEEAGEYAFAASMDEAIYPLAQVLALPQITVRVLPAMQAMTNIQPMAVGESVTVDGIIYVITKMPVGGSNGEVSVGNNQSTTATTLVIPPTITVTGANAGVYNVTSIGESAFYNCTTLASVTIPGTVRSIGAYAFASCTALTTVTLDGGLTVIGESMFSGCESLKSVTIPGTVTSIGGYAFANCAELTSVMLGEGLTVIGESMFDGCESLKVITIPGTVTSIGENAFQNCAELTSVTLGEGLTVIGEYMFYGCTSLKSVTIPGTVTSVGVYAFWGCAELTSVTLGEGLTVIGESMFNGCESLKTITIPGTVKSIGDNAFHSCTGLTSVTLGEGLTVIGEAVFNGCKSLASVTLPGTVTSTGGYAFANCTGLTSVTLGEGLTVISESMFFGCESLASVTIPGKVTSIGGYAFANCGLTSVTLGEGLTVIGEAVFNGCKSLASVTLPGTVTSIGAYSFGNCTGLNWLLFSGANAPTVGEWAFYNVTGKAYYPAAWGSAPANFHANCMTYTSADAVAITQNGTPVTRLNIDLTTKSLISAKAIDALTVSAKAGSSAADTLYTLTNSDAAVATVTTDPADVFDWGGSNAVQQSFDLTVTPQKTGVSTLSIDALSAQTQLVLNVTDRQGIEDAIKEAEEELLKRNKEDYTPESWKKVEDAIEKLKEVNANKDATQAEIDAAKRALADALNNLDAYMQRTLVCPVTGVTVSGLMTASAKLFVDGGLHAEGTCAPCDQMRTHEHGFAAVYDIKIQGGSYKGKLTVSIPVGDAYNNQTLVFLHCVGKASVERINATVVNGVITAVLDGLSPVAVAKNANSGTSPKTGDDANIGLWAVLCVIAAGIVGVVLYHRKREVK